MNKEITEEMHCIIDKTPLSDSEIEFIRALREFRFFYTLDELKEQFRVESVNDDNRWKPIYLSWSDVIMKLCCDISNALPHDVAKAIEILKMNDK